MVLGRDPNDVEEEEVLKDADDDSDVKKSWADLLAGEDRRESDFAGVGDIRKLGVSGILEDDNEGCVIFSRSLPLLFSYPRFNAYLLLAADLRTQRARIDAGLYF